MSVFDIQVFLNVVCVPLGCPTPVEVREADHLVYIGDAYAEGHVYERAIYDMDAGQRGIERIEVH